MTSSFSAAARIAIAGFLAPAVCLVLALIAGFRGAPAPGLADAAAVSGLYRIQWIAALAMTVASTLWLVCGLYFLGAGHHQARRALRTPACLIPAARWLRARLNTVLIFTTGALAATVASGAIWLAIALGVSDPLHGDFPMLHHAAVMACGGLALFAGFDLFQFVAGIRALRRTLDDETVIQVAGQLLTESAAPALWQTVRDIAEVQDTQLPDQIVLGFVEGAFITAAPVRLQPAGTDVYGCTLHLPLLTLAHLDEAECTALIAHELSHVANADIEQARALGAEQRAIAHSYDALQHTAARAQLNGLLTQPVFCITESVMAALDRAVARDRRTAEYRADRAAADASSASIAAATILRAAASQDVAQQAVVAGQNGEIAYPQRPFAVADAWLSANAMLTMMLDATAETDPHARHPGLNERLAALGVADDRDVHSRAERIIAPGQSALARYIGTAAAIVE